MTDHTWNEGSDPAIGRRIVRSPADGSGTTWPSGVTLVLVHGAMDRGAGMAHLTRQFRDVATIRYDRPGYGHAVGQEPVDVPGQVDDLVGIVGERPVVLFGHSIGGVVVLAACSRLDVRAVCTYEVPTPWEPWWPAWLPDAAGPGHGEHAPPTTGDLAERFMRMMIGDDRWETLPARTREQRRAEGGALQVDLEVGRAGQIPFDPGSIQVPVVLSFGSDRHHSAPYRRGAEHLAGLLPDSELHRLEGLTHGAPLSDAPRIAPLIRRAAMLSEARR